MANAVQTTEASNSTKVRAEKILQSVSDIIGTALPSTISRDKFRDTFLTAAKKEPKIFQADAGSVQLALIASANAGLLPDGKMAALVPFKNTKSNKLEVQFIIMVMGYIHLFKKHGGVHSMAVNVVYENDEFEYIEGDETILRHRPSAFLDDDERGAMIGVYGIFKDAEGRVMHREVMGRKAVMKAKNVSKMKDSGPWQNFEEEMWRKTLVRRASKYLPLTEEAQRILDAEDQATVDFTLSGPSRQINDGYNPLIDAAGVQQQNDVADEDGVVDHMEDHQRGEDQDEDQGEDQDEENGDSVEDETVDTDNIVDETEQQDQTKVESEDQTKVETKAETKVELAKPSNRELDEAWDAGLDAKEKGKPREVPAAITHPVLQKTWLQAWDKGEVKPAKEKAAPKNPKAPAPDADVVRDAKAKALDGADRQAPDNLDEHQKQFWLDAYDAQVKEVEDHG